MLQIIYVFKVQLGSVPFCTILLSFTLPPASLQLATLPFARLSGPLIGPL